MMSGTSLSIGATLEIHLAPGAVCLALRDWRGRPVEQARLAAEPWPGMPAWKSVLAGTAEALSGAGSLAAIHRRARRVRVLLSDAFVRYCLIRADLGLTGATELAAYARHAFRADYGNAVDAWRVALDRDARGTVVAALLEAELATGIETLCGAAGLRLDSVRPHFAATQAALAPRLGRRDTWFAVLAPGQMSAGLYSGGTWRHVAFLRSREANAVPDARFVSDALAAQALGTPWARGVRTVQVAAAASALARLRFDADWSVSTRVDPCAFAGGA